MNKIINVALSFATLLTLVSVTQANLVLSPVENKMVDKLLRENHNLSKEEKRKISDEYWEIAKVSKEIYNAVILNTWTTTTWLVINGGVIDVNAVINNIKSLNKDVKEKRLNNIKSAQNLAEEIQRSFQIESEPDFEWYAVTKLPTPLYWQNENYVNLNRIMWGTGTTWLKLDSANTIDELWVVLPPNRPLTLINKVETWDFTYYNVRTREFDTWSGSADSRYIDSRLVEKQEYKAAEHEPQLPSKWQLIKNLFDALWTQYVRGWSRYQWIPEMNELYPTPEWVELSESEKEYKILKWVDCSWLLWQATDWYTPRNSRGMLTFWKSVPISWNTIDEIIEKVEPLDVLARWWHVIIILSKDYEIESIRKENFEWGPEIVDLRTRLEDIFTRRVPVDERSESSLSDKEKFVIRRRYPNGK